MTYLKRSNVTVKKSRTVTISIVVLLALLFALHYFFPRFYSTLFYPITSIAWRSETTFGEWLSNMGNIARSKYSLSEENKRFQAEIRAGEKSMLILKSLQAENDSLKSMLGRSPESEGILAAVLARPPVSFYDTLVIDRGSKDGIKVGDKVYADGDILIGEIAEAYSGESKAVLYSTPGKKTRIAFVGSDIDTEAIGKGGGNFIASVPADAGIAEGDTVVIPGAKLHTLGVVEKVTIDRADSFSTILFKLPVNIRDILYVEVHISK